MNVRKQSILEQNPGRQLKDFIKQIGDEWNHLPTEKKNTYLQEAEEDKARYNRELEEFFISRPDILAEEIARNKLQIQRKNSLPPTAVPPVFTEKAKSVEKAAAKSPEKPAKVVEKPPKSVEKEKIPSTSSSCTSKSQTPESTLPPLAKFPPKGTINVFTDDFLEHNKCVDSELRTLRKSNTDYEMQNSILEKHVENMKLGVEKLHIDSSDLQEKNKLLETYLTTLKAKLAKALSDQGATPDNLEKILVDLQKGGAANNKGREIVRKLDLSLKL